jgi:alpha-2-macroglobulin
MKHLRLSLLLLAVLTTLVTAVGAEAQAVPQGPAFELWSSQIYATSERPSFSLTYRSLDHLDFRVYRVADPLAFFAGLQDLHQLGSPEPVVPQEQTRIERIAAWKAGWRARIRGFLRRQVSTRYRASRRESQDQAKVVQRRTLDFNTFAQVPLLNPDRVVATWRELLRPLRDPDTRRIPLDVKDPGVYVIEAVSAPLRAYTIVIVSDIGLVTKTAPGQVLVYAAHRLTGEPQSGCDVHTIVERQVVGTAKTGDDGLVMVGLDKVRPESIVSVARCGSHVTATDPGGWALHAPRRELVGYIYTDKPIYRPGHVVRIKGVLRWRTGGALGPFDAPQAELSITDHNDKVVYREARPVDAVGAVTATFPVPAGAALGYYTIAVKVGDEEAAGSFEVQEYRKPEFEVTVSSPDRFVLQGRAVKATFTARYYFGQPVAGGTVTYVVHRQPYYSPLRWSDEEEPGGEGWWGGGGQRLEATARLDDQGTATVTIPLGVDEDRRDYSARIEARVTDASNREVSGHTVVVSTYGSFFLVADVDRYVQKPGGQAQVSIRALDYLGAPQPRVPVRVTLEREGTTSSERRPQNARETVASGAVDTDADGRAVWVASLPQAPGTYRFRVTAESDARTVEDTAYVWVTGRSPEWASAEDTYLELIADKPSYAPGDTARLIVRGGDVTAPVLVTKEAREITYHRVVRVAGENAFELPIEEQDIGDTYVNILFLKNDRLYRAEKRLKVPASSRLLQVSVTADQPVSRPRQPGRFTVTVTDATGAPVKAQLSVGVIDEAVYGVSPDDTPDPLRFFYRLSYSRVGTSFSRSYYFNGYAGTGQLRLTARRRPLTLADFKADRQARPQVRKEFPDAIFWVADLATDAQGRATVDVAYPDALTTWRLTARAVTADTKVGAALARTTTTKDLILRVATPRFLTEGDTLDLPFIVHNYLPSEKAVTLSGTVTGLEATAAGPGGADLATPHTVRVAQGGEARADWRLKASAVGTATVTGTAAADTDADAVELPIPVQPFGLRREVGAAGSLVGQGEQLAELQVPESSNPAARTIRVQLAPSLAGPILGALDFLTSYPYGCTEQTLSSFVPNIVARRTMAELKIPPTAALQSLDRKVTEGLARLIDYQHDDGGWGWWKTDETQPFMTAYAVYGQIEAKDAGYKIDEWPVRRGMLALGRLYVTYPRAVPELKAYITYVLLLAESRGFATSGSGEGARWQRAAALEEIWGARTRMSAYGQALLLLALDLTKDGRAAALAEELAAGARRQGDLAWWPSERDPLLDDWEDTNVEATAFAVRALARRDPKHPLIEPAVRYLLMNRTFGVYWASTKQTAMALYGLLDVMKARNETVGDSEVEVIINGTAAGARRFTPASLTAPDPVEISVPARPGANSVRIVKRGAGAVYWAAQGIYFDTRAAEERTGSHQLALQRQYFSLAPVTVKDRIVYRESPFDGTARPGDLILVRLTAAGAKDWRYLMLEDPIPAGTEAIQRSDLYALERRAETWWWGSQREYRDNRVMIFQESFAAGRYEYAYLLKVITPGVFRASPARISAMYVPDSAASSQALTVTVESAAGAVPSPAKGGQQ